MAELSAGAVPRLVACGPDGAVVEGARGAARLSALEWSLLALRDELTRAVWGRASSRNVDRVVHELRQRLEAEPGHPFHLRTATGGYRWVSARPKNNLVRSPERAVGRERELAALLERAASPGFSLISGPPGIGKSHLARRACLALADQRPGGAWWVDVAGSVDLLLQSIGGALGRDVHAQVADRGGGSCRSPPPRWRPPWIPSVRCPRRSR